MLSNMKTGTRLGIGFGAVVAVMVAITADSSEEAWEEF